MTSAAGWSRCGAVALERGEWVRRLDSRRKRLQPWRKRRSVGSAAKGVHQPYIYRPATGTWRRLLAGLGHPRTCPPPTGIEARP
jgi:hypothetical protein